MQADITPETLENQTFASKLRGYDPDEVHSFLADVATMLRDHKQQAERAYQAVGEEMGEMLQEARDRADAMIAAAEAQAAETIATANAGAQEIRRAAETAAAELRAAAEQAAAETRRSAEEEAGRVRAEAAESAEQVRTTAAREAEARVSEAAERVRTLVSQENETHARLAALRTELVGISQRLEGLEETNPGEASHETPASSPSAAGEISLEPVEQETASPTP